MTQSDAAVMAEELLGRAMPRRWHHTQGVARAARALAPLAGPDADMLEASAWLHDIGYSPAIARTGFHPLDGATHLASLNIDGDLVALVGNHTNAATEAKQRGLHDALQDFAYTSERGRRLHSLLAYADMTTSPDGDPVTIETRLAEIYRRYPSGHVVHRSITLSEADLLSLPEKAFRSRRPPGATTLETRT